MFKVIPAVDLKSGEVVRLKQGKEDDVTFRAKNPIDIARQWIKKGASVLHVIDLDGAFQGRLRHEEIIKEIIRLGVETQVGGGIRKIETAERLLKLGASRVILGTIAVERVEDVRNFAEKWPGRIMIAIDSKKGKVAIKGWRETVKVTPIELANLYDDLQVSFLYTNIDVEGLVSGIEKEKIAIVVKKLSNPVYVAGGISSIKEVRFVKKVGAAGVVIGSALYTGKLKFEDAVRIEHEEV